MRQKLSYVPKCLENLLRGWFLACGEILNNWTTPFWHFFQKFWHLEGPTIYSHREYLQRKCGLYRYICRYLFMLCYVCHLPELCKRGMAWLEAWKGGMGLAWAWGMGWRMGWAWGMGLRHGLEDGLGFRHGLEAWGKYSKCIVQHSKSYFDMLD